MKYLKIVLDPIKIKGSEEDMDILQADLYEKIESLMDNEELGWHIDDDSEEDGED